MEPWTCSRPPASSSRAALAGLAVATLVLVRRAERRAPRLGRTVVVDGVPLHYTDAGDGPPVVFLHGAKGSVYDAALSVGPALARAHRVVAFDRPGAGYSGRAGADSGSPLVQADLLHLALRELGVARAVVVGHSAGAPVALALALAHPEDVAAVVTLGGYVFSARDPSRAPNRLLTLPVIGALLRWTRGRAAGVPAGARGRAPHLLSGSVRPDLRAPGARVSRCAPAASPATRATCRRSRRACATWPRRYADLETPVVAVHGLADDVVSAAQAVRLCQLVPALRSRPAGGDGTHAALHPPGRRARGRRARLARARETDDAGGRSEADTFAPPSRPAYTPPLVALGGEPAVPCTRNPLQRG